VRLLLDTHVLLWALQDSAKLGRRSRELIAQAELIQISAATIWELRVKEGAGKISMPAGWLGAVERSGFHELAVTWEHSYGVKEIELPHRDPFDRLLLAQSRLEQLALLTANDALLRTHPALCIDARL
jgi:PIN domain nuclease of toxin-antitoxin system